MAFRLHNFWQHLAQRPWTACVALTAGGTPLLPVQCDADCKAKGRPAIYLVMGPSGAGKDTLLTGARNQLAKQGNNRVQFVRRYVTRDPDKCEEMEIPMTQDEFRAASARGEFALEWEANRTCYAIPHSSIEDGFATQKRMVLNVSRTVIDNVLDVYGSRRGAEVYCLHITVSEAEMRRRLLGRGRESLEEIEERIRRAKLLTPRGDHVINVINEASVDEGVQLAANAIAGTMKYSLWLVPRSNSTFHLTASREIESFAAAHPGAHPFPPHVTIGKSFVATQQEAIAYAKTAARAIGAPVKGFPLEAEKVSSSSSLFFRAVVLEVDPSVELCDACAAARRVTPADANNSFHKIAEDVRGNYAPHVSFLYGLYDEATLAAAMSQLERTVNMSPLGSGFSAHELVLVMTSGAYHCWTEVARFPLSCG